MADRVAIELDSPQGEPVRIEWSAPALRGKGARDAGGLMWRLAGELDWDEVEALRIVSAALPDGRSLALAALRPVGAAGHGEEIVAAALVADGVVEGVAVPLLSVESDGKGVPLRVALELHTEAEAMPLRVAADVAEASRERDGGLERIHAALDVRLDGKRSAGAYDVLRAPAGASR